MSLTYSPSVNRTGSFWFLQAEVVVLLYLLLRFVQLVAVAREEDEVFFRQRRELLDVANVPHAVKTFVVVE